MQNKKSSFKAWLRITACIILLIFIPQQGFAKTDKTSWSKIDLSSFWKAYEGPSESDLWKSVGISFASCVGAGYLGSLTSGSTFSFGDAFNSFTTGLYTSQIAQTFTSIAADKWGFNKDASMVFGYAITGGLTGLTSPGSSTVNFFNNHDLINKVMTGTLQGAALGGGNLLAYEMLKGTNFYKDNPMAAQAVTSFAGNQIGYLGFYGAIDGLNGMTGWDITSTHRYTEFDKYDNKIEYDVTGGTKDISNLGAAWNNPAFRSDFVTQGIGTAIEYGANVGWFGKDLQKNSQYNRILGQSIGSMFGQGSFDTKLTNAVLSGGVSIGLTALGGKYDRNGKNKWGLSKLDMAGLSYLSSALLRNQLLGDSLLEEFGRFSVDYVSFGGTSPIFTKGAGGYSQFAYLGKIAELSGLSDFKANVDMSMKINGYTSWDKFVGDGALATVFPGMTTALVDYASSKLHYAAVNNFSQIISRKGLVTYEKVLKQFKKFEQPKVDAGLTLDKKGIFGDLEKTNSPFLSIESMSEMQDQESVFSMGLTEDYKVDGGTRFPEETMKSTGKLENSVVPSKNKKEGYYEITNVYYPGLLERLGIVQPRAGLEAGEAIRKQFIVGHPLTLSLGLYSPLFLAEKRIKTLQPEGSQENNYVKFWKVTSNLSGKSPQVVANVPVATLDQKYQRLAQNNVEATAMQPFFNVKYSANAFNGVKIQDKTIK